jgi:hypothetical protein
MTHDELERRLRTVSGGTRAGTPGCPRRSASSCRRTSRTARPSCRWSDCWHARTRTRRCRRCRKRRWLVPERSRRRPAGRGISGFRSGPPRRSSCWRCRSCCTCRQYQRSEVQRGRVPERNPIGFNARPWQRKESGGSLSPAGPSRSFRSGSSRAIDMSEHGWKRRVARETTISRLTPAHLRPLCAAGPTRDRGHPASSRSAATNSRCEVLAGYQEHHMTRMRTPGLPMVTTAVLLSVLLSGTTYASSHSDEGETGSSRSFSSGSGHPTELGEVCATASLADPRMSSAARHPDRTCRRGESGRFGAGESVVLYDSEEPAECGRPGESIHYARMNDPTRLAWRGGACVPDDT